MKRINGVIDKLLDRHLACELDYLEGIALQKQEGRDKDTISPDGIMTILNSVYNVE